MSHEFQPETDCYQPMVYQIRVSGHLGPQWADWFGGLSLTLEDGGVTLLVGPVADRAALHGLLKKMRDLGLPLISAVRVKPGARARPAPDSER